MGGKSKAPPPPDYSGLIAAQQQAAQQQFQLGQQQLEWAKQQDAMNRATSQRVVDAALTQQTANDQAAQEDRARYTSTFQPLEDDLVKDAKSYDSDARRDLNAGRAMANVSQQFQQARDNAMANLESYGIDPSQTRYAALDLETRTQEAAARASAGNQSYLQDDATARQLRADAINVGKGYPSQVAQAYGTSQNAGNQAVNSTLATTASGASTMGTNVQYQGLGNQSLSAESSTMLGADRNNISRTQVNNQASSGLGSVLGMATGLATSPLSGSSLLGRAFAFEEGGPVPGRTALPEDDMMGGTPVPAEASPSQGAITDDVPARLNAGEFVVPRDVVSFKGEEFFQKLIASTRKQEQSPGNARPRTAAIPAEAPAIRTALPMG
ncbi:hypothetical protein [Methylobacterium sp. 285MFTsu5.1]|uniref:hypothetical protein n=1 Tax=Methylobacterium sp. 285MFTsu5.1 TaxID=1172187 RepID=UPI00035FCA95|nr:hypothetical protein [Methylobacterium sp. 285MFTsu5.1]